MKILVVEDSLLYRKTIVKYLREHLPEAEFITAGDGEEGYALFQQESPDFVVLDLLMPKMNGIQLLTQVKKDKPETRAAVISADIQKLTRDEVERLGVVKFYNKPFSREQAAELASLIQG